MLRESVNKAINVISAEKAFLIPMFPLELFPEGIEGVFMYQHFPYEPVKMRDIIVRELEWKPIKKLSSTYVHRDVDLQIYG